MRILLTGFEAWGRVRANPSGEVARRLGGRVLPVDYGRAGREIVGLIRTERPDAVVMLGLAETRRRISLEALALNIDHCEGRLWRRWRRPIAARGPAFLESRLPLDRIHRRLSKARIPVAISHHAGTFICNHVFYLGLLRSRVPCGFVHLPPIRVMPLRTQLRALRLVLETLEG